MSGESSAYNKVLEAQKMMQSGTQYVHLKRPGYERKPAKKEPGHSKIVLE